MVFCSANEKNRLPLAYDGARSLLSERNVFSEPLLETNLVLYLDYLDVLIVKIYNILGQDTSFDLLPLFLLVSTLIFPPILTEQRLSTEPSIQPVFKKYTMVRSQCPVCLVLGCQLANLPLCPQVSQGCGPI